MHKVPIPLITQKTRPTMKKHISLFLLLLVALPALGQHITFEHKDYRAIGVYDRWEQSPFRDGRLTGHAAICANPDTDGNTSDSVVAFRRSRWASNIYGARIDLTKPFTLTPQGKVVHVLIHRPQGGRVMLVGLGKRHDRPGESAEVEQFWTYAVNDVAHDCWGDAVFPVKSANGVDIHSLVVVPDAESPHHMTADWVAYIDDILVDDDQKPRISPDTTAVAMVEDGADTDVAVSVTAASRNGTVVTASGQTLNAFAADRLKPLTVKVVPAPGFRCKGLRIKFGQRLAGPQIVGGQQMWQQTYIGSDHFEGDQCTLPATCLNGEVEVEGDFVSVR